MDNFNTLLLVVLPAIVVAATVYYVMQLYLKNEREKRSMEEQTFRKEIEEIKLSIKQKNAAQALPVRLQAYERLALLLERISPDSLVMRSFSDKMSAQQFQSKLTQSIRDEFEHNYAQQVYVSANLWKVIRKAKEETIQIVNLSAGKVGKDASAVDLSKEIFDLTGQLDNIPTHVALDYLKQEVQELF